MWHCPPEEQVGLLLSGGLDSAILLHWLLQNRARVQPLYVAGELCWESPERAAIQRLLTQAAQPRLAPLVEFEQPLRDVYGDHWSVTGADVPNSESADEAVFLPGRNLLLALKPALWCQLHGVSHLALGVLNSNPFPDATSRFFKRLQETLDLAVGSRIELVRPFAELSKQQVMELGVRFPLEHTFSCISPVAEEHCGQCNKCAERQAAFRSVGRTDPTHYAAAVSSNGR